MPGQSEGQGLHYNTLHESVPPERRRRKTAYLKNPCFRRVIEYAKNPHQANVAGELGLSAGPATAEADPKGNYGISIWVTYAAFSDSIDGEPT